VPRPIFDQYASAAAAAQFALFCAAAAHLADGLAAVRDLIFEL